VPVPQVTSLFARISPLAALVLALTASAGCHVGESPADTGDEGSPAADGGDSAGGDDGADDGETPPADGGGEGTDDLCATPGVEATPQSPTHAVGYEYGPPNTGQGCLETCHNPDAPDASANLPWAAGGSLYTAPLNTEDPVGGAVIVIEEMGSGTKHVAVSSENGQFRFEGKITYPAITYACPPKTDMIMGLMDETYANCGRGAGCHISNLPIYLTAE
jgi:hypothetical protein